MSSSLSFSFKGVMKRFCCCLKKEEEEVSVHLVYTQLISAHLFHKLISSFTSNLALYFFSSNLIFISSIFQLISISSHLHLCFLSNLSHLISFNASNRLGQRTNNKDYINPSETFPRREEKRERKRGVTSRSSLRWLT